MDIGDSRIPANFWRHVNVDSSGCWLWTGSTRNGYGQITLYRRNHYVHRVAFAIANSVYLPEGSEYHVHHTCKRPTCCNPGHLELITARTHRAEHMGKPCPHGLPATRWCTGCTAARHAAWQKANPARRREIAAKYYQANSESRREYSRRYRLRLKETAARASERGGNRGARRDQ